MGKNSNQNHSVLKSLVVTLLLVANTGWTSLEHPEDDDDDLDEDYITSAVQQKSEGI